MPYSAALNLLKQQVKDIDNGIYPLKVMQALGKEGFFYAPIDTSENFIDALRQAEYVSRICGATGFMLWCQSVCAWYLLNTDNDYLGEKYIDAVASGELLGGTALSNPMKYYAGFENLKLTYKRQGNADIVSGSLPWVSNILDGHVFGFIANCGEQRKMYLATVGKNNVKIKRTPLFTVMDGTATFAVQFKEAPFTEEQVLAVDADSFVKKIRNGFVMLQYPIGTGLLYGMIELMQKCLKETPSAEDYLPNKTQFFEKRYTELWQKIDQQKSHCFIDDEVFFAEVLALRLELAETVLAAAQHLLLLSGARGLFMGSDTNRRIREAQFYAVLSPSIRHLRKELQRYTYPSPELDLNQSI